MHARDERLTERTPARRPAPPPQQAAKLDALGLQRSIGNAALGQVLQRAPKDKGKGKEKAKPVYKPVELSDDQMDWSFERLHGWAGDRYKEKNFREAAAFFEAAYWKQPSRQISSTIMMCFRELKAAGVEGAAEMYEYWGAVANGSKKPTPPPWLQHA